jgi:hypothetical protein
MRNRIWILALALPGLLTAAPAAAQDLTGWSGLEEPIAPDRPDFTEGTGLVPPGHVQVEGGATVGKVEDVDTTTFGELLIRIGTGERWEGRIGVSSYNRIETPLDEVSGFDDPTVGMKVRFTDPAGDLAPGQPAVALVLVTSIPEGDEELTAGEWVPKALLVFDWVLGDRFSLSSNLGYTYQVEEGERFHQISASLSSGLSVTERLGAYLEWYGFSEETPDGATTHYLDGGMSFLVTNDLQLDARIGTGLNDADPDWYAGVGASVRW